MEDWTGFSDEDLKQAIFRALRLLGVLSLLGAALTAWKFGWPSSVLLLVGAAISGSGLWEWQRLMAAVVTRMDAGQVARPMGRVLVGFFLRLGLTVAVLYVSLKTLDGSVFAVAGGFGLGVFSLTVVALRKINA